MIEFVDGNFFDYEADIRVNTVNCVGVMGTGVALQFKKRFPKMYEEYVRECNLGKIRIGKPHVWTDNEIFHSSPTIINLPTKDDWKEPSEYEYVEKGLVWLRDYLKGKGDVRITLPALGCGHGGLDWNTVKQMIVNYLQDLNARILVFEPSSSTNKDDTQDEQGVLEANGVAKLSPGSFNYPKKLAGRSSIDIFLKGDSNLLERNLLSVIVDTKAEEREKLAILDCIQTLPNGNFVYLLSYNSGFEIDIVKAVLNKKAKVIVMLPYGILNLKIRKDLLPLWDENNITIMSLSKPSQSWSAYESINSLKFRIKLASAILIANYNLSPLIKLEKEFKNTNAKAFFLNYWREKVEFYKHINALQIGRDKETQKPNLSLLYNTLNN